MLAVGDGLPLAAAAGTLRDGGRIGRRPKRQNPFMPRDTRDDFSEKLCISDERIRDASNKE